MNSKTTNGTMRLAIALIIITAFFGTSIVIPTPYRQQQTATTMPIDDNTQLHSIPTHSNVNFFYNSFWGGCIKKIISNPFAARIAGFYTTTRLSTLHIKSFIKKHHIAMNEAIRERPEQYHSFNDFFTRTLKPSARPIDQGEKSVISPADGYLHVVPNVQASTQLTVKGKPFILADFLGYPPNAPEVQQFMGGTAMIIYLAPWNYHRFHFPCTAIAQQPIKIHGRYESVHPSIFNNPFVQPLQENERNLVWLATPDGLTIAYVPVGAMFVGQISYRYTPYGLHKKGDEMGFFSFGGSTVVLLFPPNSISIDKSVQSNDTGWTSIKMGQKIGTFIR